MQIETGKYWLDSLFLSEKNENSLESKMNKISKLIVLSFFIFVLYIPIKKAFSLMIGMLFGVSTLYYYLLEKYALKENYEEKIKDNRRTFIGDLDFLVHERQREIYIPDRNMHQITYRTIVPLESIATLTLSDEDNVGNPKVLNKIKPLENIYSQQQEDNEYKSFLEFSGGPSNKHQTELLSDDTEIFRRTNIDHLNLNPNAPANFQEIDKIYMKDMMKQRNNYEKQILNLNLVKDEHKKIAPIHQNFRVQGYGGPSFVANYKGPRGQM